MYFLYSLEVVTSNQSWITLSILFFFHQTFRDWSLWKNALTTQVGMLGDMFLMLVANLKQWPFVWQNRLRRMIYEQRCNSQSLSNFLLIFRFFQKYLKFLISFRIRAQQAQKSPVYSVRRPRKKSSPINKLFKGVTRHLSKTFG